MSQSQSIKTGVLKKRSGRMHRWSTRYFTLCGGKLSYKIKVDSPANRGEFDLLPGCVVTEVQEDTMRGAIKGKRLFSFWIVWPDDKSNKQTLDRASNGKYSAATVGDESDNDEKDPRQQKDLKQIVQSEAKTLKQKEKNYEEQIEKHQAYDNNVSLGESCRPAK
jgi:hypothetical protein